MTDSSSLLGNSQAVVDANGRVTLKNISSGGIDFDTITEALVKAKRAPAISLEKKMDVNSGIVTDYQSMKAGGTSFNSTLDTMRGSTSSFTSDVFDSRTGTVQTYASDTAPGGHVPSANVGDIMGVSLEEGAPTGNFTLEVKQKATAHQIRSDAITSKYDDISTLVPPLPTGTFTLNGVEVNITDSDSLSDIAAKLNNANKSDPSTGISATIVSADSGEHYLTLSSDATGEDNKIVFGAVPGQEAEAIAVLNGLGLTTGADIATATIKNETTAPQNSIIDINGLGVDIERSSNTIDDVLEGVTIDIYKAEPDTIIEIGVSTDLVAVKQGVVDFVNEYNEMRDFINEQQTSKVRELDDEGEPLENGTQEFGNLAFDSTFRQYAQSFTEMSSFNNLSLDEGFQSLSQLGIKTNAEGKLEIDNAVLDERLLKDVSSVEKLFSFNMASSSANVTYISNGANTQPNVNASGDIIPYYLSIEGTDADGNVTGASLRTGPGENDYLDGTVEINGTILTFTDATGAEQLKIVYNGGANMAEVQDIEITPTRGIADSFYYTQKDYIETSGQLDDKITNLIGSNEQMQSKVDTIDRRLEKYEDTLRTKFIKTEQAMAQSDSLLKQLEQMIDAMDKSS